MPISSESVRRSTRPSRAISKMLARPGKRWTRRLRPFRSMALSVPHFFGFEGAEPDLATVGRPGEHCFLDHVDLAGNQAEGLRLAGRNIDDADGDAAAGEGGVSDPAGRRAIRGWRDKGRSDGRPAPCPPGTPGGFFHRTRAGPPARNRQETNRRPTPLRATAAFGRRKESLGRGCRRRRHRKGGCRNATSLLAGNGEELAVVGKSEVARFRIAGDGQENVPRSRLPIWPRTPRCGRRAKSGHL